MRFYLALILILALVTAPGMAKDRHKNGSPPQGRPGQAVGQDNLPQDISSGITPPVQQPALPRAALQGNYTDDGGAHHPWTTTPAHSLIWDGAPWVPVGVTFIPASLNHSSRSAATADDTAADNKQLDALAGGGIRDLLLETPSPGVTRTEGAASPGPSLEEAQPGDHLKTASFADFPPEVLQPLLAALDHRGIHYGINLHGTVDAPLAGYSFGETFLLGTQTAAGVFTTTQPAGADGGLFVARDGNGVVLGMGMAHSEDRFLVATAPASSKSVYFVPLRKWGTAEGVANVWDGFAACRDRILFGLHPLKFGPGLRFFLNPMEGALTPVGRAAYFYPSSHHFQIEYEAWLRRHYLTIEALSENWRAAPGAIADFETASRLVPNAPVSPNAAWDPEKDKVIPLGAAATSFWTDFESFRSEGARHAMDILASSLRHNIADVPVVYSWSHFNKLYTGGVDTITYDGLAFTPGASADDREIKRAAYACAQVADNPQNRWFMVYGVGDRWTLGSLGNLVDLGAKGFFLGASGEKKSDAGPIIALARALRDSISGGAASTPGSSNTGAPQGQLTPVNIIAPARDSPRQPSSAGQGGENGGFDSGPAPVGYADYWPNILYFPWDLQVASVRRFEDGMWWLPSFRPGDAIAVGPDLQAYRMAGSSQIVLWSPPGPRTIHVRLEDQSSKSKKNDSIRISWPPDARLGKASRGIYALSLGDSPVLLEGVQAGDLFPEEALDRLFQQSEQVRTSPMIDPQSRQLVEITEANARHLHASGFSYEAYVHLNSVLDLPRRVLLPYVWLEGEKASPQTFNGTATSSQCSGSSYLWLNDPDEPPPGKPYMASWSFTTATTGVYEVWMGGTPPGEDWSSSVRWTLDGLPVLLEGHGAAGLPYQPLFHWSQLAALKLAAGSHTLVAAVTGRRLEPDNSYFLGIDTVVFRPTTGVSHQYVKSRDAGLNGSTPGEMAAIERETREPRGNILLPR